jgi:hypothetical protein
MDNQQNYMTTNLFGRHVIGIALLASLLLVGQGAYPRGVRTEPTGVVRTEPTDGSLSCHDGLGLHLSVPQSPDANLLRMRSGLELRASERLLTITTSYVEEAHIREYRERLGPKLGEETSPVERPFFWVTLQLNRKGMQHLDKVLTGRTGTDLVLVCNGIVLRGKLARYGTIQGIDVLIDEPSAETAEQFVRSFTSNIRWERRAATRGGARGQQS